MASFSNARRDKGRPHPPRWILIKNLPLLWLPRFVVREMRCLNYIFGWRRVPSNPPKSQCRKGNPQRHAGFDIFHTFPARIAQRCWPYWVPVPVSAWHFSHFRWNFSQFLPRFFFYFFILCAFFNFPPVPVKLVINPVWTAVTERAAGCIIQSVAMWLQFLWAEI